MSIPPLNRGVIALKGLKNIQAEKYEEIQKLYLNDNRPWVIGYSGGKDSTTVVQIIFEALALLVESKKPEKLHKPVYVITSDTLIENPLIIDFISSQMKKVEDTALAQGIPMTCHTARPTTENSFWSLLIGKGYPTPRQKFRWCTDRLKIKPIDQFIYEQIDTFGEAIVILGVRSSESASRSQTMKNHSIEGRLLKKHTSLNNAFVYAPIADFTLDDVWGYLHHVPNPWGGNNDELRELYADSMDASECPLQLDQEGASCGNSRFGCWVCTVVQEDKSLNGFIKNGHKELIPLLKFRTDIMSMRENDEYRMQQRSNGTIYYVTRKNELGETIKVRGKGPFNLKARKKILEKLLTCQMESRAISARMNQESKLQLVTMEELKYIRQLWIENGDWEDSLPKIYESITGESFIDEYDERPLLDITEIRVLANICEEHDIPLSLMQNLVSIERDYDGVKSRNGILNKIGNLLKQDWLHEDIIEELEEQKAGDSYENN